MDEEELFTGYGFHIIDNKTYRACVALRDRRIGLAYKQREPDPHGSMPRSEGGTSDFNVFNRIRRLGTGGAERTASGSGPTGEPPQEKANQNLFGTPNFQVYNEFDYIQEFNND